MKKRIRSVLLVICIGVFAFSLYKVVTYYYGTYQSQKRNSQLEALIHEEEGRKLSFMQKYGDLIALNDDMIGWLSIEDTKLNYPVMQTVDDEEFYLRRNFDKEYEFRGTLFVNANANLETDDNIIIYGHNMDDGTMFGALRKYTSYDYYLEHRYIQFDNLYDSATYEIAYVFKTVDEVDHELFIDYYNFFNASSSFEFNAQMQLYESASFYDTGIRPRYGDRLITLSTCEYSHENGRLVIVARKIDE